MNKVVNCSIKDQILSSSVFPTIFQLNTWVQRMAFQNCPHPSKHVDKTPTKTHKLSDCSDNYCTELCCSIYLFQQYHIITHQLAYIYRNVLMREYSTTWLNFKALGNHVCSQGDLLGSRDYSPLSLK